MEKNLYISETQDERTISKTNPIFILFLHDPGTSEEVTPFYPLVHSPLNTFQDEAFHDVSPLDD